MNTYRLYYPDISREFFYRGLLSLVIVFTLLMLPAISVAENSLNVSVDDLLQQVKQGRQLDAKENSERLQRFRRDKDQQQHMLAEIKQQQKIQEQESEQKEQQFEKNELEVAALKERLTLRLGALKELFGVLQQVSGDAQAQFYSSLTQLQYPERTEYLAAFSSKMGQTSELPSIEEIERLWFELQQEMTASGKIVAIKQKVISQSGEETEKNVLRVGAFNIVADGRYLQFIPETGRILEYARQPAARYLEGAEKFSEIDFSRDKNDESALIPFTIDPTRGQLLELLVAAPNMSERIQQGGIIGYIIMVLGAIAALIAVSRFIALARLNQIIQQQIAHPEVAGNNPLGRILQEYTKHQARDLDTLEFKLGEALMREVPPIQRGLSFLKLIAAVAPLLGLLGTVTGMIITFQSIVLFGAGDPKMMAGGISQALVTTVQGLSVAIPTLLIYNLIQTRAKALSDILEQEAVALIAEQAEKHAGDTPNKPASTQPDTAAVTC